MCGTMWRLDGPDPFLRRTYRCLPWRAAVAVMSLCPPAIPILTMPPQAAHVKQGLLTCEY